MPLLVGRPRGPSEIALGGTISMRRNGRDIGWSIVLSQDAEFDGFAQLRSRLCHSDSQALTATKSI